MAMSVFLVYVHVFLMVLVRSRSEERTVMFSISTAFALAPEALGRKRQEATADKSWGNTKENCFGGLHRLSSLIQSSRGHTLPSLE